MSYIWMLAQEPAVPINPWIIVGGWVVSLASVVLGQGFLTRRAVNKHGDREAIMQSDLGDKVDHMAKLQEQHNTYSERRLTLCEDRLDRVERTVYKV